MEDLIIEPTQSSPEIRFNAKENRLYIQGKSYIENTAKFYGPVFSWLETYLNAAKSKAIEVTIELIYFNSSSFKVYMNVFDMLEEAVEDGENDITINWRYDEENEMALEYGEEFQEDLSAVTFNLVEISS